MSLPQSVTAGNLAESDLPTNPETLFKLFDTIGLTYQLHHHPAVFTVAEGEEIQRSIPGVHCRNLFLRDKKERMALVMLRNETNVDLKRLAPLIGLERISFGSPERLFRHLGVRPGSVCPFAVINDQAQEVQAVLDHSILDCEVVNFHPLLNTMTVGMSPQHLIRFLEHVGHLPHIVDLTEAAPVGET